MSARGQVTLPGSFWLTAVILTPVFLMVAAAVEQCRLATQGRERPTRLLIRRPGWLPYAALAFGGIGYRRRPRGRGTRRTGVARNRRLQSLGCAQRKPVLRWTRTGGG